MGIKYNTKQLLRIERVIRGWTQEDVAKKLNMACGSYTKYETGDNEPTSENILKLAELYELPTDYLLGVDAKTVMKRSLNLADKLADDKSDEIVENIEKKRVRKKKQTT